MLDPIILYWVDCFHSSDRLKTASVWFLFELRRLVISKHQRHWTIFRTDERDLRDSCEHVFRSRTVRHLWIWDESKVFDFCHVKNSRGFRATGDCLGHTILFPTRKVGHPWGVRCLNHRGKFDPSSRRFYPSS